MRRTMTLSTYSTKWVVLALVALLCLYARVATAHSLHDSSEYAPPATLEEVEQQLARYRSTGDDAWLHSVETYFENTPVAGERGVFLRAWHAQAAHHFSEASEMLGPLLRANNTSAWLLEANLQRITGNREASEAACRRVSSNYPLLGQTCLLQTRTHLGLVPDRATVDGIERILNLVHSRSSIQGEQRAWIMGAIADAYYVLNELPSALAWSERAFQANATIQHRAAYASRLIDLGKPSSALEVIGSDASAPSLVVLRFQALQRLGQLDQAQDQVHRADHQFRQDIARGDLLHAREMAVFYLDILPDDKRSRWLIVQNWARQKELEDRALLSRTAGAQ